MIASERAAQAILTTSRRCGRWLSRCDSLAIEDATGIHKWWRANQAPRGYVFVAGTADGIAEAWDCTGLGCFGFRCEVAGLDVGSVRETLNLRRASWSRLRLPGTTERCYPGLLRVSADWHRLVCEDLHGCRQLRNREPIHVLCELWR